jgi:hypothetical protein
MVSQSAMNPDISTMPGLKGENVEKSEKINLVANNLKKLQTREKIDAGEFWGLLEYLCKRAEAIMRSSDWYELGQDIVIEFDDCSGNDLFNFLKAVAEYGIDLDNVQIYSNDDGWVVISVMPG